MAAKQMTSKIDPAVVEALRQRRRVEAVQPNRSAQPTESLARNRAFVKLLLSMPDVGEDADFNCRS
ncbi:hypothetical protein ACLB1G_04750 [Oxalobacteraceae bacterium A2-2]